MLSETTGKSNGVAPSHAFHVAKSAVTGEDARTQTTMRITERNGTSEPVNVDKIVRAVNRCCIGLPHVDTLRVATRTISGLYDGATTRELDQLSIRTAAGLIADEPQYAKLAARLLATYVDKEVRDQGIHAFSQSVATAHKLGLIGSRLLEFVTQNARQLNDAIVPERDSEFEYFGLRTVYDRYLLKHPRTRLVLETPQQFFLRIACSLSETVAEALELYRLFSMLEYLPSSPTLFNSGTRHEQLSSCFLLDSPDDHLEHIYQRYTDVARLSMFSGGIGLAYHPTRTLKARDLYARMMRTLAQTGNGWITFKDKSNRACNQTALPGRTVHLSNLCTEILEVTSRKESAVCNLGSINLARHIIADDSGAAGFDFDKLATTVRTAVRQLDRVIDLNSYPIPSTRTSNQRWRPVGLGIMGLQDVFFQMRWPFDAPPARALSRRIAEEIYFHALSASVDLAVQKGRHPAFDETRAARGELQFESWDVAPADAKRWDALRLRIRQHGLRNSLLVAIAPTATIASIAGCCECIEPQVSNLFKRETLSGDFLQINRYLVEDLKALGLWSEATRARLKLAEGSVQAVEAMPASLRAIYRTAWEIPMRSLIDMAADRGAFIDQSQSLNLFVETPNIGQLSSMYFYAWKKGLKTTYYLRSRPATRIAKATVETPVADDGAF